MPQILKPADFLSMPWKNGRGTTREIARDEEHEPYHWRLSLAPIQEAGPFSRFPGYHRILTLVEGKQLLLMGPRGESALQPGDVHSFDGNEATESILPQGPVRDLGILFQPQHVRPEMKVVEFPRSRPRSFAFRKATVFFFAAAGECAAECFPGGESLALSAGQVLRLEAENAETVVSFEPRAAASKLICVTIEPRRLI